MKQTRRHELRQNDLRYYLQQIHQTIERNSTYILAGVLAVVVILVIGMLIQQRRANKEQTAWTTYYELRDKDVTSDRDALERVRQLAAGWGSDANLGPPVLALQGLMENQLALSIVDPREQERKVQLLKDAVTTYQNSLSRFSTRPDVAVEARMSLAGIEESLVVLGQGNVEKLRGYYQQVIEAKPNSYVELAAAKLANLDKVLQPIQIVATRPAAATLPASTGPAEAMPAPVTTRPGAAQTLPAASVPAAPATSTAPH